MFYSHRFNPIMQMGICHNSSHQINHLQILRLLVQPWPQFPTGDDHLQERKRERKVSRLKHIHLYQCDLKKERKKSLITLPFIWTLVEERNLDLIKIWNPNMQEQLVGSLIHNQWKLTTRL